MKYHNEQLDHDRKNSCPVCRKQDTLNTIHNFSNRFHLCPCGITSYRTLVERIPYLSETKINIVFAVTNESFLHSDYKRIETAKLFYKYEDAYLYYRENIFNQWKKVIQTGIYPDQFSYTFPNLEKINITVSKNMSDEEIKRFIHAIENFKILNPYTCTFGHRVFTNAINIHAIQDISETDSSKRTLNL